MEKKRVLLVEDNSANRMVVEDLLRHAGYEVRSVVRAEDALEIVAQFRPALILMDIQLPEMDGLTATRILRENEATRKTPIIALTAHAMSGDRERCLVAGCNGYITKPIRVEAFRQEIALILDETDSCTSEWTQT